MNYADEMNGPNFEGDIRHGQIWLKGRWHAIFPREAVLGDIADWCNNHLPSEESHELVKRSMKQWLEHYAFAYGDQWEEAWKGAHTYKYIFNRTHALDSLATVNKRRTDELQQYKNELENQVRLRVQAENELTEEVRLRVQTERELDELKHDIGRHVEITTEQANTLAEREEQVSKLQQQLDEQEIQMRKLDQLESDARANKSILNIYIKHSQRWLKRIDELNSKLKRIGDVVDDYSA